MIPLLSKDADAVRVYDCAGGLVHLVSREVAQKVIDTGAFTVIKRRKRRSLIPVEGQETAAAQVIADLDEVVYDQGRAVRVGYAHRLETDDNPRGVITISRIPASLRAMFTKVVDECAA